MVIAALGVVVFQLLSLPLPFLFGPLFACLLAALARRPLADFGQISVGARTILGVAIGAMLTPDVVAQVPRLFLSVALVPVYIVVIGAIGVPFFQKFCGFDRVTAWYAASLPKMYQSHYHEDKKAHRKMTQGEEHTLDQQQILRHEKHQKEQDVFCKTCY